MKVLTPQQEEEHQSAVIAGAAKGFFGGLAVALPLSYLLQRRSPYYRSLTPALKAFGVVLVAVPSFVICAERSGLAYERSQYGEWHVSRIVCTPASTDRTQGTKSEPLRSPQRGSAS